MIDYEDDDDDCDDGKCYGGNYVTVEQDNEVEIGEAKKLHSLGTAALVLLLICAGTENLHYYYSNEHLSIRTTINWNLWNFIHIQMII